MRKENAAGRRKWVDNIVDCELLFSSRAAMTLTDANEGEAIMNRIERQIAMIQDTLKNGEVSDAAAAKLRAELDILTNMTATAHNIVTENGRVTMGATQMTGNSATNTLVSNAPKSVGRGRTRKAMNVQTTANALQAATGAVSVTVREVVGKPGQGVETVSATAAASAELFSVAFEDDSMVTGTPGMPTREFLMAGKATFTFQSKTGEHFTFKVTKPDQFRGEYFANVMTGTDNEKDFSYVGMMNEYLNLRGTKGSKLPMDDKRVLVLKFALDIIAGRKPLPQGYTLQNSGKCGHCGKKLTTPESLRIGLGPDCRGDVKNGRAA